MNSQIKIIFLDLDGTLLNSDKKMSPANRAALAEAAANGIYIVPASGRLAQAIMPVLGDPPFVQYVIAVNGAVVYDCRSDTVLAREELAVSDALRILDRLYEYPGICDCYIDGGAYMDADMLARAADYTIDSHQLDLVRRTRMPVPDLRAKVTELGTPVQKCQIMFTNAADRDRALAELQQLMPEFVYSCSYSTNIEINSAGAHKGAALQFLCDYLGIPASQAMSFGDNINDISMLETAGIGVVMGNAAADMFRYGQLRAPSCDEDGVAKIVRQYVLEKD